MKRRYVVAEISGAGKVDAILKGYTEESVMRAMRRSLYKAMKKRPLPRSWKALKKRIKGHGVFRKVTGMSLRQEWRAKR